MTHWDTSEIHDIVPSCLERRYPLGSFHKCDANRKIQKYNAQLMAQGFTQVYGIDFPDVFTPVARLSAIQVVIALGSKVGSRDSSGKTCGHLLSG